MKLRTALLALSATALAACGSSETATVETEGVTVDPAVNANAFSRDRLRIVGSSTVYPFSTTVAENFGNSTRFNAPIVESTGSGGGLKLFCAGVGEEHPDITNASRRIKQSEVDLCASNGVDDIVEMKIGYDGIVLANSRESDPVELTLADVYLALAKDVPTEDGTGFRPNPYTKWSEVNAALPDLEIDVLGPPPTSGTRDAFVELAMEGGCKQFPMVAALKDSDGDAFKARCHALREDGLFKEAGEQDNLIIQKLRANPNAFGIFGYSFLDQNRDTIQAASINGVKPSFDKIADGDYPVARSLYVYLKGEHADMAPGLKEFASEFISDRAAGDEGYLADKGLIPLPAGERTTVASDVTAMRRMKM